MNRPRRAAKKPMGPEISVAECAELRRKITEDPSKLVSRVDGIKAVQKFFSSSILDVTCKQLSLICPITGKRIVDPAHGVNCSHLESFDLSAYLFSQVRKPLWECPRCQKRLPAEDLRIDELTSYLLRIELDSVRSVEVYSDSSHRAVKPSEVPVNSRHSRRQAETADVIILDDEPIIVDTEDKDAPKTDPLVTLPLSVFVDFARQTKDFLRRLPVKKGKRKADDPADLLEEHHDTLRTLIKEATSQAKSTGLSGAARQNEDPSGRNSALLAEIARLNHRVAELEQELAIVRPKISRQPSIPANTSWPHAHLAGTRKNTAEVLMWLDRFSLDAVQLSSTLLKAIVDDDLPLGPLRVLESVGLFRYGDYTVSLEARCPWKESKMQLRRMNGEVEELLRRMFSLCSGCAIESLTLHMPVYWTPTISAIFADNLPSIPVRRAELSCSIDVSNALITIMQGMQSLHLHQLGGIATDETVKLCLERGVASLCIGHGDLVTDEALLDFCFSDAPTNRDREGRFLIANFREPDEMLLSRNFLEKLLKKCIIQKSNAMPSVYVRCDSGGELDLEARHWKLPLMTKTHDSRKWQCKHFQFKASGDEFEVVVHVSKWCGQPTAVFTRKGHANVEKCPKPKYLGRRFNKEFRGTDSCDSSSDSE